jgi:AcrR family transcriptional regulator
MIRSETPELSQYPTANRLVEAVLQLWCEFGTGEISTRMLAGATALPASGIYYHFANVEQLYLAAQRRAIEAARTWCDAQFTMLDAVADDLPAEALGAVLANTIDSFCEQERKLAFAWRECQILATRDECFRPPCERWHELWCSFWQRMCARLGLGDDAQQVRFFFDGESFLHLMRWNRTADRAALDEMAVGWVRWLTSRVSHAAPWRAALRSFAQRSAPGGEELDASARKVAAAAARLLIDGGAAAVTHRAVAATADMTLGTVSHKCRRTNDLLRLAYAEVYRSLTGRSPFREDAPADGEPAAAAVAPRAELVALDELLIAVARGRADRDLALQLRYLRGSSTRLVMTQRGFAGDGRLDLISAIFSSVMMGAGRELTGISESELEAAMTRLHDQFIGDVVVAIGLTVTDS